MMSTPELPKDISYFQISRLILEPIELWLQLELVNPISPKQTVTLELRELAYLSLSKTPEDNEGCYQIGEIQLSSTSDPTSLLKNLGYGFSNVAMRNDNNFWHLHIEGDLCLDAVSGSCKVIV